MIGTDDVNADWNGIWDVVTSRDSVGWTAVFRIPFRTLRFSTVSGTAFGFNVQRFIRRKNEQDLWRAWRRTEGFYQLLREGELVGLGDVRRGSSIELLPYVLGDARQAASDSLGNRRDGAGVDAKVGLDAKLAVTPTLTADFTANTDFAEVEIDSQVINLTRLPTFFPEKREFFLESSGIFDFGSNREAQLFYSRAIGLSDSGVIVPMYGGARLYGRVGPWAIGVLDAQTGGIDEANDAVVRVKRDLFDRSYLGAMLTARIGPAEHGADLAGGVDGEFPLVVAGQNLVPSFWAARRAGTSESPATGNGWRVGLDFPNDLFDNNVRLERVDSGFVPALGFVERPGAWFASGHLDFMPGPGVPGIRQLDIQLPGWDIYANEHGFVSDARDWQTASIDVQPLGGTLENGDQFQIDIQRQMDAPTDTFTIVRGVNILPAQYWWSRIAMQYATSFERPISLYGLVSFGHFYDGRSTETDLDVSWRSGGHLILGAGASRTEAWISAGHFVAVQSTSRIQFALTTRADRASFLQVDNVLHRVDADVRFHWIPVIGDDLYVVWNSGYTTDPLARFRFPDTQAISQPLTGTFVVKFVHRVVP